jgi:TRAP-type C4-dicarboxylate transport system permease small subunit
MLGIVTDVARRTLTGRSVPGMVELVETFMALEVFLGLAHAEAEGVHVRMSLVTNLMAFRIRRLVKTFGMAVCVLGSVWFAWGSTVRAIDATAVAEVKPGLLRFPVWPARWAIAFGFAVLIVEYVARVWEEWHAEPSLAERPLGLDEIIAAEAARESRIVETLDRLNEEG